MLSAPTPPAGGDARLRRSLLVAFALPTVVLGVMHGPEGQIQAIYAKHAGLSLTALAAAMLLTRIFDAITYPVIGYLSDRSYARTGTRRGWILAGTVLSVLGTWFLMRPPPNVGIEYFGAWTAVLYLGWKVMEIPLQAWSYGLSTDYAQRARVQAWRALAQLGGQLLFFTTPLIALTLGYSDSTELDFRSLGVAAVICAVALPLASATMLWRVPDPRTAPVAMTVRFGFRQTLAAVRYNAPLLRLIAAFLPVNTLVGMVNGVSYFYVDTYLALGKQYPAIMALSLLASLAGIPFWTALSARYERHRVWAMSLISGAFACIAFSFITPGPLAVLTWVIYPAIFFTLVGAVIVYTMSADIVDYGRLHCGEDHGGLYGALFAFMQKSLLAVSAAAGVALVGAFGFDATASVQSHTSVLGLKLVANVLPALGMLGAAAIIWHYPLTRERITQIQAVLAERTDAAS